MNNGIKQFILKTAYISTGVPGFILSAIPKVNGLGGWLLKQSEDFLNSYEKTKIEEIANLEINDAKRMFDELSDGNNWSPKICIALALKAGLGDKTKTHSMLDMINDAFYDGCGSGVYSGAEIVLIKDIEKVKEILSEQTKKDKPSNLKMK